MVTVRARTSDPSTSQQAAQALEQNQARLQASIVAVVTLLTDYHSLTDFEIRDLWPEVWAEPTFSDSLPCKARGWARDAGLVKYAGYTRANHHSGRQVMVWELGRDRVYLDRRQCCPTCQRPMKQKDQYAKD